MTKRTVVTMSSRDSTVFLKPDWPAPTLVGALVTTRIGGVSAPPYAGFNLAAHVGDAPSAVTANRNLLQQYLTGLNAPQWLQQVHGTQVAVAHPDGKERRGDAVITDRLNLPCAILTADCLPVFFCDQSGDQVAVAHAGWRGLAAGVLEAVLARFVAPSSEIIVWLGPAIGPKHFEVGASVRDAFVEVAPDMARAFSAHRSAPGQWFANLYQIARYRLQKQGVTCISGGDFCTYADAERFYSYRRDGLTGRMASLIWRKI